VYDIKVRENKLLVIVCDDSLSCDLNLHCSKVSISMDQSSFFELGHEHKL